MEKRRFTCFLLIFSLLICLRPSRVWALDWNRSGIEEGNLICITHQWDEGVMYVEPTCLTEGRVIYTCSKCGDIKTVMLPMKDHMYGPWQTVMPADNWNEGVEERVCSYCGTFETRTIPVLDSEDIYDEEIKKNAGEVAVLEKIIKKIYMGGYR